MVFLRSDTKEINASSIQFSNLFIDGVGISWNLPIERADNDSTA